MGNKRKGRVAVVVAVAVAIAAGTGGNYAQAATGGTAPATTEIRPAGPVPAPTRQQIEDTIATVNAKLPPGMPSTEQVGVGQKEVVDALMVGMGISEQEAEARVAFDSAAGIIVDQARSLLADSYTAAAVDFDTNSVTVTATGQLDALSAIDTGGITLNTRLAAGNADDLNAAVWEYNQTQAEQGSRVRAKIDEAAGTLIFQTPDSGFTDTEKAAAKAGAAEIGQIWVEEPTPVGDELHYGSCEKWNCDLLQSGIIQKYSDIYGNVETCTSGVLAYKTSENYWHMMGAGHCADPNYSPALTGPPTVSYHYYTTIGPVTGYYVNPTVPLDMAATRITAAATLSLTSHLTNTLAYVPVGPLVAAPVAGQLVCSTGERYYSTFATYACGYIAAGGAQAMYSGGPVSYVMDSIGCSGDSGALVFRPQTVNGVYHRYAIGLVSSLSNVGVGASCYTKTGIVSLADNFAVWNSWGWSLVYYAHPNG